MAPPGPMKGGGTELWDKCIDTESLMDKTTLAAEMSRPDLQVLSREECFDTFAQDFVSGQRLVVLVTNDPMPAGEPVVLMGAGNSGNVTGSRSSNYMWMCGDHRCTKEMASQMWDRGTWNMGSDHWGNVSFPDSVPIPGNASSCSMAQVPEQKYRIEYCLTVPKEESCQLVFSLPLCLVVIGCNLVKLICALFTARDSRAEVLVTTGDAIASYLACPDQTTEGVCLLSKPLIDRGSQDWHNKPRLLRWKSAVPKVPAASSTNPLQLEPRKRWLAAASTGRWVLAIEL